MTITIDDAALERQLASENSNYLTDLAARVENEHRAAKEAIQRGAEHAMRAGELLIEAKAHLGHGRWLPWLADRGIAERTSQLYMHLARNREAIEANPQRVADLSVRGAVELVALKPVRGTLGTGETEWYTPAQYIEAARQVLGAIDLDPATAELPQSYILAERFHTLVDDGLRHEWRGRVWLNPPYAQPHIADFVQKMVCERTAGRVSAAILLTHNYTDTAWFHDLVGIADAICFTRGRVGFKSPDGDVAAPTQGQAFFYFGEDVGRFSDTFGKFGFVVFSQRARRAFDGGGDE